MYRITIEEIVPMPYEEKEYQKISDTGNPSGGGATYGYILTGRTLTKETRAELLMQTVETLDIPAVIKAVNGI